MSTDYRGVRIGMTAEEVRSKLDELKKGDGQDFLVFSDRESAQIYYDDQGRVTAVSIDYFGENNNAPSPDVVLGAALEAKADGSMYQLNRYPEAGYWVSYNRTAGDKPIVTITNDAKNVRRGSDRELLTRLIFLRGAETQREILNDLYFASLRLLRLCALRDWRCIAASALVYFECNFKSGSG